MCAMDRWPRSQADRGAPARQEGVGQVREALAFRAHILTLIRGHPCHRFVPVFAFAENSVLS